jgi:hypothetical protein
MSQNFVGVLDGLLEIANSMGGVGGGIWGMGAQLRG